VSDDYEPTALTAESPLLLLTSVRNTGGRRRVSDAWKSLRLPSTTACHDYLLTAARDNIDER
jgi:hypothetical protein